MTSVLEQIIQGVVEDVASREAKVPFQDIKAMSREVTPPRNALEALQQPGCGVIAEIKRASPCQGQIARIDHPAELAQQFEAGGARMIGCQTERRRFMGSLEDLAAVKTAVSVPVMSKDFIVDPYQIHEARYYGADMVPLIVSALDQARLESLLDRIESLGMTALAEVHTPEDASRAIQAGAKVVGVNARNLHSMTMNPSAFGEIAPGLPRDTIRIALSGVRDAKDLRRYASAGADAIVIGESLVTAPEPMTLVRTMVAVGQHPATPTAR
ncbi:indole-3-glycerol phosphate synthase TrpC [Corynebacterium hindlerae]|uniref:indole-3-glycerol phosphate synthase TrpC n=1 Tax=Corynebacterium hindlerae TaxID=699041 RepID=UPI001AD65A8F|nr:indole-3-glycerol phosphate synthase TrpC [Corynebacterium hindlerae]QTH58513.1 indole-3-glycerol phosphate synthase TrpC [Corynebacterium hindlerae]